VIAIEHAAGSSPLHNVNVCELSMTLQGPGTTFSYTGPASDNTLARIKGDIAASVRAYGRKVLISAAVAAAPHDIHLRIKMEGPIAPECFHFRGPTTSNALALMVGDFTVCAKLSRIATLRASGFDETALAKTLKAMAETTQRNDVQGEYAVGEGFAMCLMLHLIAITPPRCLTIETSQSGSGAEAVTIQAVMHRSSAGAAVMPCAQPIDSNRHDDHGQAPTANAHSELSKQEDDADLAPLQRAMPPATSPERPSTWNQACQRCPLIDDGEESLLLLQPRRSQPAPKLP
jgi:hypothetical protein